MSLIKEIYQQNKERFATTGTGYRLTFLGMALNNLEEYDFALEVLREAIRHSDHFQYTATRAVALNWSAVTYRQKHEFKIAIDKHIESISCLNQVGSSYYLAEAYYQLGLTHQAMEEIEKSQESLQAAIQLFSEMEAPKQVERVRRSMQNSK